MATELKHMYLQNHPLFANVNNQKISEAALVVKIITVSRGETISFADGEFSKLYLLISGKIKIAEFGEGDAELIKDIITAPDIFGNLVMDGSPSKDVYAEALTSHVTLCAFNVSDFKNLLQGNPIMGITFAKIISGKLTRLEHRHSDLVFCNAKSRLIHFIKNWAQTDGNRVGDKIVLNNYLTHTDIANSISTSRQSVNILFNELRDAGMLFYNRKQIELSHSIYWN